MTVRLAVYVDSAIFGGAERGLENLLGALGPHVEVTVLGTDPVVVRRMAQRRPGSRLRVVPAVRGKWDLRGMVRFARVLSAARPDVLQITLATPWQCRHETLVGLLTPGVRVVLVENLPLEHGNRWVRGFKRALSRRVDAHVAVGRGAAREVEQQVGLPQGSVRTIELAVEEFEAVRDGEPRPRPRIGTTARLDRQKGIDVLLRALPALPDVDVEIVGDGPEREPLERLARELGVDGRVTFAGWSERARDWLGRWDAFVLPSRYEGLPLAILDALLASLPVVAADVGSVREAVVHEETGLLVAPDDVAGLAAALNRVLADRTLAERMGRRARVVALERFTAGSMARRYEALYEELLSDDRRRRRLP